MHLIFIDRLFEEKLFDDASYFWLANIKNDSKDLFSFVTFMKLFETIIPGYFTFHNESKLLTEEYTVWNINPSTWQKIFKSFVSYYMNMSVSCKGQDAAWREPRIMHSAGYHHHHHSSKKLCSGELMRGILHLSFVVYQITLLITKNFVCIRIIKWFVMDFQKLTKSQRKVFF